MRSAVAPIPMFILVLGAVGRGLGSEPAARSTDQVLQSWVAAAKELDAFEFRGRIYIYDRLFKTVKVSDVCGRFQSPVNWRLEFSPSLPASDACTDIEKSGIRYSIQSAETMFFCRNGPSYIEAGGSMGLELVLWQIGNNDFGWARHVLQISPESVRTGASLYGLFVYPQDYQSALSAHHASIERTTYLAPGEIQLLLVPDHRVIQRRYKRLQIIFDEKTSCPKAVQITDPTGNQQCVIVITTLTGKKTFSSEELSMIPPGLTVKRFELPAGW